MIKAFLFDNGGVMTPGGGGFELSDRLGENLGISTEEAWKLLGPAFGEYICGRKTENELWVSVEKAYGKPITSDKRKIWNTWDDDMQSYPEMIQLVQELKAKGYTVGMLSNVIPNTAKDIREHGGYDIFDFTVLSCEVGHGKPEKEIYELALEKLAPLTPEEIVFIDDIEAFLVPARELGMLTILATCPQQVINDVNELL